jgi:hypothetical protein
MEILELVAVSNTSDVAKDDQCPFCLEKPVGHATKKPKEVNDKVTSVPSDLGCTIVRRTDGDLPYTTAQHHLISAMQCYARIRRLVRMGNMVGYDINNPTNGIGLPTTHWTLKYPQDGKKVKYGDLDEPDGKRKVAFALMTELGAQWHVGHHAFDVLVSKRDLESWKEAGAGEKDTDDVPHETSYDVVIIGMLFNLLNNIPTDMCEDPNKSDKLKKDMDAISKDIRERLEKFNGQNGAKPKDSSPLFVSMRAYEFSGIEKTLKPDSPPKSMSL